MLHEADREGFLLDCSFAMGRVCAWMDRRWMAVLAMDSVESMNRIVRKEAGEGFEGPTARVRRTLWHQGQP